MVDEQKVINFIQDFGCAKLQHLQILFDDKDSNFRNVLKSNVVSRTGNVFVHNTRVVNEKMLIALDVLCELKPKLKKYRPGKAPSTITLITTDDLVCNIMVADKKNKKGLVSILNSKPLSFPMVDRIFAVFYDESEEVNIVCDIPIYYIIYPSLEVIYYKENEKNV